MPRPVVKEDVEVGINGEGEPGCGADMHTVAVVEPAAMDEGLGEAEPERELLAVLLAERSDAVNLADTDAAQAFEDPKLLELLDATAAALGDAPDVADTDSDVQVVEEPRSRPYGIVALCHGLLAVVIIVVEADSVVDKHENVAMRT